MKKVAFFLACAIIGLSAGWWWSERDYQAEIPASDSLQQDLATGDQGDIQLAGNSPESQSGQIQAPHLLSSPNNTDSQKEGSQPKLSSSPATGNQQSTANSATATASNSEADENTKSGAEMNSATSSAGAPATSSTATDPPPVNQLNSQPPVFSYHDGIMKVAPSVVSLYASTSLEAASLGETSQGSGVIVASDGIVLTNLHLVEDLTVITIVLSNGSQYPGTLIGSDRETDLAVVKIPATNLPYVKLDDAPPVRVGDVVLAIGNPFGVGQTVTQGIVSATRRRIAGGTVWQNFLQIDAAINPGNSGGALINPHGQLVGVNTAVFRGESNAVGIGFSIPADLLAQVVPQIIDHGSVARGWLGIGVDDLRMFPTLLGQTEHGAVITSVLDDSPAGQSGLRRMDIVTQLGEQKISSATQLSLLVSALPPGGTVQLSILRRPENSDDNTPPDADNLQQVELKMRLGTRPNMDSLNPR